MQRGEGGGDLLLPRPPRGRGDQGGQHLAVRGGAEGHALRGEGLAQGLGVDQVPVVGDEDAPQVAVVGEDGLGVLEREPPVVE